MTATQHSTDVIERGVPLGPAPTVRGSYSEVWWSDLANTEGIIESNGKHRRPNTAK